MPRTTLDRPSTEMRRYNDWLRGELARRRIKQKDMATYLHIDQPGLSRRLQGRVTWTFKEVLSVLDYLDVRFEDIF